MPKNKKNIKVHDLKPSKDAKGGRGVQSHQVAQHDAQSRRVHEHRTHGQGGHQGR
jgi:hypothetical protein